MPSNVQLGRAIRRQRRVRDLSIEALAFAADLHPTYLSAIERGLRSPTWGKLCGLARALNITIAALAQAAEAETLLALADALGIEPAALVKGTVDLDADSAFRRLLEAARAVPAVRGTPR
jgi:transcriptional regulator with XRE-family HTH domain